MWVCVPLSVCVCQLFSYLTYNTDTHTQAYFAFVCGHMLRVFCCLWFHMLGTLCCAHSLFVCLLRPFLLLLLPFSLFVVNVSLGLIFTKLGICPEYAKQFMRIVMCSDRFKAVKAGLTASACWSAREKESALTALFFRTVLIAPLSNSCRAAVPLLQLNSEQLT